jgi:type I restriction enzyme R subunit
MSTTDISEKGLETLIIRHMTGVDGLAFATDANFAETPGSLAATKAAGSGWLAGNPKDYDRTHALDVPHSFSFLHATQPDTDQKLGIGSCENTMYIKRPQCFARHLPAPEPEPEEFPESEQGGPNE